MAVVKAQCGSCSGTGLYSGMCEGPNEAVICLDCNGTGCKKLEYKPYEGRKRKYNINRIRRSAGRLIIGPMGGHGESMTYEQFKQAIPEESH
jgi:hypothetical protein